MSVLARPYKDKKNLLPNLEEVLMMEAWYLLKNEEESDLFSLSTFSLIIKLYPSKFLGPLPLACLRATLTSGASKPLLIYHFTSHWIISVLRHKEPDLLGAPQNAT